MMIPTRHLDFLTMDDPVSEIAMLDWQRINEITEERFAKKAASDIVNPFYTWKSREWDYLEPVTTFTPRQESE